MEELARRMAYEQLCRNLGSLAIPVDEILNMAKIVIFGPTLVKILPFVLKEMFSPSKVFLWPIALTRITPALAQQIMTTLMRIVP